ncbi:MAG: acyl carrier protein [Opitutae bacterium]
MRDHLDITRHILADQLGIRNKENIKPSDRLVKDLGADSIDIVEIAMAFEDKYNTSIPDDEVKSLTTVAGLVAYLEGRFPNEDK